MAAGRWPGSAPTSTSVPRNVCCSTGITGTNGKTTTAFILEAILNAARRKSALVGTVEYHLPGKVIPAPHTTPEPLELMQMLSQALAAGATEAVMEVSSHALEQQRVFGVPFDVAVFSNLTRDHLDYHVTFENYFAAKRILFEGCGTEPPRCAILNVDDEYGRKLLAFCRGRSPVVYGYGLDSGDFHARNLRMTPAGNCFQLVTPAGEMEIVSPLIGAGERLQRDGRLRCRFCQELYFRANRRWHCRGSRAGQIRARG